MPGIYVHIPYCRQKCGYCSFISTPDLSGAPLYLDALKKEISGRSQEKKWALDYDSVYIGGGTPSVLPHGYIKNILGEIRRSFTVMPGAEITVEANPESADGTFFGEISDAGVNRLSLGLQSCNNEVLKKLGRISDYNMFINAYENAVKCGITNISADVIIGIPFAGSDSGLETVSKLTALEHIKHISVYSLKIEEGTQFYTSGIIINEDSQADEYEKVYEFLKLNGFMRYEVSNFARSQAFESRHNKKYWSLDKYLGLGAAAHSFSGTVRYENTSDISKYIVNGASAVYSEPYQERDLADEYIMLSLRTRYGTDCRVLKEKYNYDILNERRKEIGSLTEAGFLLRKGDSLILSENAYYIMDSVVLKLV